MTSCCHNEFVGFRNRYLKDVPHNTTYCKRILDKCILELVTLLKPHFEGKLTTQQFLEGKVGKLGVRYVKAFRDIQQKGFCKTRHSKCSAFVKNELYDELKPPRMIINRDPRFTLVYGRFTQALEHAMMKIPQFSKGKNFLERGKQFADLIGNNWILEGDCSKFEGSQRLRLLGEVELAIWKALLNSDDYAVMQELFCSKMSKNGYSQNGVKFQFYACRGSGDADTGLFNSILSWLACRYFEIVNKTGNGNFQVDGDDNGISIPRGREDFINTFAHFGFDAKLILRKDYHDFNYCSGKYIQINKTGDFMYIQNFRKVINNMRFFRKRNFEHCRADYYHSLGFMYKVIYGELPLIKEFADMLLRSTEGHHVKTEILYDLNPMYHEQLKHRELKAEYDEHIITELALSLDLTIPNIRQLQDYFKNSIIKFRENETKRYRNAGSKIERPTFEEMREIDDLLMTRKRCRS
jgi:hypothetical protein